MAEDNWQEARLIPTSGINGQDEAERRATSALLSVMGSVREFGQAMVKPLGAPGGQLMTYIEVPFTSGERTIYPDGALQATRAGRTWTACRHPPERQRPPNRAVSRHFLKRCTAT